jgi:archaellum component FlaC
MSDILRLLKEIRDELREIKLLYKELVEKLIPVEEPLEDEKEAIEVSDEVVSEDEMMKTLKTDTSD